MTTRKLPLPPAVEIALTDRDLCVLEDALLKYAEQAVPRLLDGEIRHLESLRSRVTAAQALLDLEREAIARREELRSPADH